MSDLAPPAAVIALLDRARAHVPVDALGDLVMNDPGTGDYVAAYEEVLARGAVTLLEEVEGEVPRVMSFDIVENLLLSHMDAGKSVVHRWFSVLTGCIELLGAGDVRHTLLTLAPGLSVGSISAPMSDSALLLVARVDSPCACAERVLSHLAGAEVIEALPTDSALGALAHRPGPRVLDAVKKLGPKFADFRTLRTNGLEVSLSRSPRLFTAGDEMPTFTCPGCAAELDGDDGMKLAGAPVNPFRPPPTVACQGCKTERAIGEWKVENGAFGNLALRFWNWWPLEEAFIARLAGVADCALTQLHEHI